VALRTATVCVETARLLLRTAELSDRSFFVRLLNDPSWLTNIGDRGVRSDADAEAYIRNTIWVQYQAYGYGMYLAQLKSTSLPIGICGLVKRDFLSAPDLGFALLPDYVGQGYASETARELVLHSLSNLGIRRLYAIVKRDNLRSIRLLGRLGFHYEGPSPQGAEVELYTRIHQSSQAQRH
jgi:RimJ/RimL family protein N-acetyltransferase